MLRHQFVEQIWFDNHREINKLYAKLYKQDGDDSWRLKSAAEFRDLDQASKDSIYNFVNGHKSCPACREGMTVLLQRMDPTETSIAKDLRNRVTWPQAILVSQQLLQEHMAEYVSRDKSPSMEVATTVLILGVKPANQNMEIKSESKGDNEIKVTTGLK